MRVFFNFYEKVASSLSSFILNLLSFYSVAKVDAVKISILYLKCDPKLHFNHTDPKLQHHATRSLTPQDGEEERRRSTSGEKAVVLSVGLALQRVMTRDHITRVSSWHTGGSFCTSNCFLSECFYHEVVHAVRGKMVLSLINRSSLVLCFMTRSCLQSCFSNLYVCREELSSLLLLDSRSSLKTRSEAALR